MFQRCFPYFLFYHTVSTVVYQSGHMRLCDSGSPCPPGSVCMYSPNIPGVQGCYEGVSKSKRHNGRCPVSTDGVHMSSADWLARKTCLFDEDCPLNQRCCNFFSSPVHRYCVTALSVVPEPKVLIIVPGQINPTDYHGTVALVQTLVFNVLFDSGGAVDKTVLLDNLRNLGGIFPRDIDFIVTSHGHADHTGNTNLFPDAEQSLGPFIISGSKYEPNPLSMGKRFFVNNESNLEIVWTPGHSPDSTSLIVRDVPGMGTMALTGDLFLYRDEIFENNPRFPHRNPGYNKQVLMRSRQMVACMADFVIPGHGNMFKVDNEIKNTFYCARGNQKGL